MNKLLIVLILLSMTGFAAADTLNCSLIVGKGSDGQLIFGKELIELSFDDAMMVELRTPFGPGQPTYKTLGYKSLVRLRQFESVKDYENDAEPTVVDIGVSTTPYDRKLGLLNSSASFDFAENWDSASKKLIMKFVLTVSPQNPLKLEDGSLFDYAWVYIMDTNENKVSLNCWQA